MKYEYCRIVVTEYESFDTHMDSLGADGWELVSVDNGTAFFKRPLSDSVGEYHKQVAGTLQAVISQNAADQYLLLTRTGSK